MESIPFIKASACGNDFLLIDRDRLPEGQDFAAITRQLCDRHDGVGADGIEWLSADPDADVRALLVNADGSPAEISGNGTRCVAAYMASQQSVSTVEIRTDAGIKTCTMTGHDGNRFDFDTAMGEPQVGEPFSIKLAFGEVIGIPVSVGNPHFVVFVEKFIAGWQAEAAEIGRHHDFKHGINVELVKIGDKNNISVRFFERGVGETRSSGTGSCAAAVASIFAKKAESPVQVHAEGGIQTVRWEGQVFLGGSAQLVCRGDFFV